MKRLERIRQVTSAAGGTRPEALFEAFSDHLLYPVGMCAHAQGNIQRGETVAAVVMQPNERRMHVRKGLPCASETQTFRIDA